MRRAKDSDKMNLGEILCALGALDDKAVEFVCDLQKVSPECRFGEVASQTGFVTPQDVETALRIQERLRTPGREVEAMREMEQIAVSRAQGLMAPPVPDDDDVTPVIPMQEMIK